MWTQQSFGFLRRVQGGTDPYKLQRQIARYGAKLDSMPPPWVYEAADGVLEIVDAVTRATRAAKLASGQTIRVEVIGKLHQPRGRSAKIGDLI